MAHRKNQSIDGMRAQNSNPWIQDRRERRTHVCKMREKQRKFP